MSARARGWALLGLAFVLMIAAGVAYVVPNRLALTGQPAIAQVVATNPGDPATITVQFTTEDGRSVEATTSKAFVLAPVGTGIPIRYDPDDPTQVADERHRESSPLSTLLVVAFTATVGAAIVTWRKARQPRTTQ
jgi:hypothetical protein